MKKSRPCLLLSVLLPLIGVSATADTLRLGNEPWPPFVIEGDTAGTAEAIVCEALDRSGRSCSMVYDGWAATLEAARVGDLDGIAAAWYTIERGRDLQFSAPYLTNRLIPVWRSTTESVRDIADLDGRRVAMEVGVAFGDSLLAARERFEVIDVRGADEAIAAVREDRADVAIVDELFAIDALGAEPDGPLQVGEVALSYRELHFAVSRAHPNAGQIIADFNGAYQAMVRDGSVNRILDLEWLATDLESDGVMDFIHRGGGLDAAVADVASRQSVYALGQDEFEAIRAPGFLGSNANYLADEEAYETPEAAMRALETDKRCRYDNRTAHMVCQGR